MGKFIEDLSKLNWDFISGAFELGVKIAVPILIVVIKPWRMFFSNGIKAIKFVINMMNPKHELYYEGVVSKVKTLHDKHEEENSEKVKQLEAIIAGYEAEKKAQEKKGFDKLQQSFESLDSKVENALDKLLDHDKRFEQSDEKTAKIFLLIEETKENLLELKKNQYKSRRAA